MVEQAKIHLKEPVASKEDVRLAVESAKTELKAQIESTRWVLGLIVALNLVMLGVMLSQLY